MRLVRFLIHVLEAHAETLKRLAEIIGEDALLNALENMNAPNPQNPGKITTLETNTPTDAPPYDELQSTVADFKLSPALEDHLWSYPYYRMIIESMADLNMQLDTGHSESQNSARQMVEEAFDYSRIWIKSLKPPLDFPGKDTVSQAAWLQFRSTILRRLGYRPLSPTA
ncbi:MAG: hypothetical protein AABZ06_01745 [Bdellovibrionota bacterium]